MNYLQTIIVEDVGLELLKSDLEEPERIASIMAEFARDDKPSHWQQVAADLFDEMTGGVFTESYIQKFLNVNNQSMRVYAESLAKRYEDMITEGKLQKGHIGEEELRRMTVDIRELFSRETNDFIQIDLVPESLVYIMTNHIRRYRNSIKNNLLNFNDESYYLDHVQKGNIKKFNDDTLANLAEERNTREQLLHEERLRKLEMHKKTTCENFINRELTGPRQHLLLSTEISSNGAVAY